MRDLGIGRVAFAQINLVATLTGALFCVGIGRLIDHRGSRIVLTATVLLLGAVVLLMSRANGLIALLVFVTLTRGFGQSALSVVSLAMVGKWFRRRLTRAMAVYAILAARGFAPEVYHTALAVTAITGLIGNFAAGAFADRGSLRHVLVAALLILTMALVALAHVTTVGHDMAQAVAMGIAGGFVMVVFFSFWGRAYGRAHLGRIQGAARAMTVVASAVGPLFLALCVDATGSYVAAFYVLAGVVAALAGAAAMVRIPAGADSLRSA